MSRTFTDQLGRSFSLDSNPKRIVSLVPSQTELLHDLGLGERVVGITKFCVHPENWFRTKTRVGGTKKVNHLKIRELKPDLIIANKEENTAEDIEALSQDYPVWISDADSLDYALSMIHSLADICEVRQEASNLVAQIKEEFGALNQPKIGTCIYLIWNEPIMAAGSDTFIRQMLDAAGFENLAVDERYPELSEESLEALDPEYLLLSSEPFPFNERHVARFKTILPNTKIILVDGEMFSWYGSRLRLAPAYFAKLNSSLQNI